jgi:putative sigma-54 modulation protein
MVNGFDASTLRRFEATFPRKGGTDVIIETRAIGFSLTDAIQRHVEHRVESTLGALSHRILKVTVRLEDVNALRGGVDKRCGVVVALRHNRTIVAEAVNVDMYAAVDAAVTRARHGVVRRLMRPARLHRQLAKRPAALA